MEQQYSEREINLLVKSIDERQETRHQALLDHMRTFESVTTTALSNNEHDLKEIKTQTQKTNGRVSELEVKSRVNQARINIVAIVGGFVIASIIVPLLAAFISAGKV